MIKDFLQNTCLGLDGHQVSAPNIRLLQPVKRNCNHTRSRKACANTGSSHPLMSSEILLIFLHLVRLARLFKLVHLSSLSNSSKLSCRYNRAPDTGP